MLNLLKMAHLSIAPYSECTVHVRTQYAYRIYVVVQNSVGKTIMVILMTFDNFLTLFVVIRSI